MAGVPPKKNTAYSFEVALVSQSDTDIFQTSPTLAAGDVTVSKDGGSFSNIGTLPTEIGSTGVLTVALTSTEMNADRIAVLFNDAAGDEWQDLLVLIETDTQQITDIPTVTEIDTELTTNHGSGAWTRDAGTGAISTTITINDGSNPLDGCRVMLTNDEAGSDVVASGYTNANGQVTLYADAGDYYVHKQLAGYSFSVDELTLS